MKPLLGALLTSEELSTLATHVLGLIKQSNLNQDAKDALVNRLSTTQEKLDQAIYRKDSSPFTPKIEEADSILDESFLALRHAIEANAYHWIDERRQDATTLLEIIRQHGYSMQSASYSSQTASTRALIEAFRQPDNAERLKRLELTEWASRLEQSQATFEGLVQRRETESTKEKPLVMVQRRALLDELSKSLCYIESIAMYVNPDEGKKLIQQIDGIINSITATARSRGSRRMRNKIAAQ